MQKKDFLCDKGMATPVILVVLAVFFVFATGIMSWSISQRKEVINKERGTQALQVAEAGIDYYRWHLAHDSNDFQDGNAWCCNNDASFSVDDCGKVCGPYTHIYKDYDGDEVGEFSLSITIPAIGSTITQVESTGKTYQDNNIEKTIVSKLGKMSLARYSLLSNAPVWIGENEATSGPLHSNGGIRFDGTCDAEVTSGVETYNAYAANHSFDSSDTSMPGIWGSTDPNITKYWSIEPPIDFGLFTVSMADIADAAENDGGIYLGPSGMEGYKIVFRSDAKIDIYVVNTTTNKVKYYNDARVEVEDKEKIQQLSAVTTYDMPDNGLIFIKDDVWLEGTVNGRVTVAASRFTSNANDYAKMYINDSIQYIARDGNNVLGLMAEGEIIVPKHAPNELVIDAVMLSQKSHVYARDYKGSYRTSKQSIEVYGGIITNLFWTWGYVDDNGNTVNGYRDTDMIYDNHLTFSPPPSFPTEENFSVISWFEK